MYFYYTKDIGMLYLYFRLGNVITVYQEMPFFFTSQHQYTVHASSTGWHKTHIVEKKYTVKKNRVLLKKGS